MVASADAPLNRFLEMRQWWPPNNAETSYGSAEVHTECRAREASQDRIQQMRLIFSEASFETVGLKAAGEDRPRDDEDKFSPQAEYAEGNCHMPPPIKDVPPCFALFTRFNCNVTLVAQKLFNAAMGVSVLCSGTAAIEEGRDSFALQMLKHAKPGELVYVRHVMLTAPESRYNQQPLPSVEPFSYGFLVARLESLSPQVRDLVLSESLPFGAVLDRCGVRRSVETDRQLHVHMSSSFFDVDGKLPHPKKLSGTLNEADVKNLDGKGSGSMPLQTAKDCQCKVLPEGSCCTFGRLITVWCDGQPAARVVEILNERLVLRSLLLVEEQNHVGEAGETTERSACIPFESRFAFLVGRCLMSVALCPVHYKLLPRPHMNAQILLRRRDGDESCRLCGSKSCSTEFVSAYTADLQ